MKASVIQRKPANVPAREVRPSKAAAPEAVPTLPGRAVPALSIQRKPTCPCGGGCPRCAPAIQPKLMVGAPNDKYEQQADRIADEVMRMPEPTFQRQSASPEFEEELEDLVQPKPLADQITPLVQRQAESEEEREEEDELMQPKMGPAGKGFQAGGESESWVRSLNGSGRPLDRAEREFFEPRLGCTLDRVRVHTGGRATIAAKSIGAMAFTIGHNIVLASGQYCQVDDSSRRLLAHEMVHTLQQRGSRAPRLQPYTIDASCRSPEPFEAEHWGGITCQNGTMIENGSVLTVNFADLPNRCSGDDYSMHSEALIDRAAAEVVRVVSAADRPEHCLREEEFQRGVLAILENTTIRCDTNRRGGCRAGILSNTIDIGHDAINSSAHEDVNYLANKILHEALHIWEGRFGPFQHTGIVTPCTAACFPTSRQFGVDTNPEHCTMPSLTRPHEVSIGLLGEATRGGGMGLALSYRRSLFSALQGHLTGHAGVTLAYERLFSDDARRGYGQDLLRFTPFVGVSVRPGVLDRTGLVFNLTVGPTVETGFRDDVRGGLDFSLGAGMEFDFLYFGAGFGAIVPLSDRAETILNLAVTAGVSF